MKNLQNKQCVKVNIVYDFDGTLTQVALPRYLILEKCNYEKGSSDNFSLYENDDKPFVCSAYDALLNQRLKSQSCAKIYMVSLFKDVSIHIIWTSCGYQDGII